MGKLKDIAKKKIKKKLITMALPFLVFFLLMLSVSFVVLFQLNDTMALLPSAEVEQVEEYKEIAALAGLDWSDMVIYDTVRYENDFEQANPNETALEFLAVHYKRYREVTVCVEKNEKGECIKYDTEEELAEDVILETKEEILAKLKKHGFKTGGWGAREVIEAFKSLISQSSSDRIEAEWMGKDIEDVMANLTEEQLEWAHMLSSDYYIHDLYGESIDLPDHIMVDGNSFFAWPVPSLTQITSPFGYRIHPVTGEKAFHYGIDIAGANAHGQPIIAAADGVVFQTNTLQGAAGNNIRIRHYDEEENEWQTRYCHLSVIAVRVGQEVKKGDVIGAVGNTGRSTGPHLHLELKFNGQLLDPYKYIR